MRGIVSAGTREHRILSRDPDQDGGAAVPRREERRSHRLRPSGRLDRVVDAAARRLSDRRPPSPPGCPPRGRPASRRARARRSSFALRDVHGDDLGRARRDRAEQRGEADPAAADDRDAVAGPDARGVPHGPDARRDRAADEPGDVERDVLRDHDARALGDDAGLGERRDERVVVDRARRRGRAASCRR